MRLWISAAAVLLAAMAAPTATAGTRVTVQAYAEFGAPKLLWIAPAGATVDRAQWVALQPRLQAKEQPMSVVAIDHFEADVAAGTYALVGFNPAMTFPLPSVESASGLRAPRARGEQFVVPASGEVDLGRIEVYVPGSLGLIVRDGSSNSAWIVADADDGADPVIRALRARIRSVGLPTETASGGWLVRASGNRVALSDASRHWRVFRVLEGGFLQAASMAGDAAIAVGGQGPQLQWVALDGPTAPMSIEGLPTGAVAALQCDAQARCVVAVRNADNATTLAYSADARSNAWTRLAQLPAESCGWAVKDCSVPAQFHRIGDRVLGVSDGTRLLSVDLADGKLTERTAPGKGRGSLYVDDRLIVGKSVSTDGGLTWEKFREDDLRQTAADGTSFLAGAEGGIRFKVPITRRRAAGASRWSDNARAPAFGGYVVGRKSPRQYQLAGTQDSLWVSTDAGRSWHADRELMRALVAAGGAP